MKRYLTIGASALCALMFAVGASAQTPTRTTTSADAEVVFCTMDAKMCPDGSYVGRQGPNCEFAPCPPARSTGDGETGSTGGSIDGGSAGGSGGKVEYEWKIEEGESAPPDQLEIMPVGVETDGEAEITLKGDAARGGEKGGTEDINIGVGENSSAIGSANGGVWKTSDMRGWNAETKQEFLGMVKTHAELRSGQDLEHFAQGILLQDEKASEVTVDENGVAMAYQTPAKFLGLKKASFRIRVAVDHMGTVKVKYPWYALLFTDYDTEESATSHLQQDVGPAFEGMGGLEGIAKQGAILNALHFALKAHAESRISSN